MCAFAVTHCGVSNLQVLSLAWVPDKPDILLARARFCLACICLFNIFSTLFVCWSVYDTCTRLHYATFAVRHSIYGSSACLRTVLTWRDGWWIRIGVPEVNLHFNHIPPHKPNHTY
jgi:hypothetical protein